MISSSTYIKKISKDYSLYVCSSRGIPNIPDGLKDVQRKILWGLKSKSEKIKTSAIVGHITEENLYVHGDAAGMDAVSHLAAPYCNNVPLISGDGNFGSRVSVDGWAAGRYTYVKKSKITEGLIYVDIDIIPMKDNYDGSTKEPVHFLPLIPIALLNGISGIAVGWSTEILPHSYKDIVQGCIDHLKGKKVKKLMPSYDYLNCNVSHIEDNSYYVSGKINIKDTSTVEIIELSPYISVEKFKENLNKLEETGVINGYIDNSTKTINIIVKFPRGYLKDKTEEAIIDILKMKQKKTERIVVIDFEGDGIITYDNPENLLSDFVDWRLKWFKKRYEKFIEDDSYELTYQKGLRSCILSKLSDKIGKLKTKQELRDSINKITKDSLDESQQDRLMSIPFYKWTNDFIDEVNEKINKLEEKIKEDTKIKNDNDKLKSIYISDLENIKKLKI